MLTCSCLLIIVKRYGIVIDKLLLLLLLQLLLLLLARQYNYYHHRYCYHYHYYYKFWLHDLKMQGYKIKVNIIIYFFVDRAYMYVKLSHREETFANGKLTLIRYNMCLL